jgi:hypothetical protein
LDFRNATLARFLDAAPTDEWVHRINKAKRGAWIRLADDKRFAFKIPLELRALVDRRQRFLRA